MGRTHPAGLQTASRTCLAIFPTNSADGPPVPSSVHCGGEQSREDETGKVKMRKQNKKITQAKEPYWTFLYFIYRFLTQRNQPVCRIFCIIGINAKQQLYTAVGNSAGFHTYSHAARHLPPVWLCSRRLHVLKHGAATSCVKGDTSGQKCFLSRKQRLGILPRPFNCKSRCKEDSCCKYTRGIKEKPVMQTHTATYTADRNNIMLKNL